MAFKADMSKAYDRLDWNFIRGNFKSCGNLNKVIKDYCHASGQVINDNKSSMTFSPCSSLSFARKCLKTFNIPCGLIWVPTWVFLLMWDFQGVIKVKEKLLSLSLTRWVNGNMPKPLCLELLTDSPNLSNLKIRNLIYNSNCWDQRLVSMSFDESSAKDILAIPIRCSEGSDNFFWSASSSGNYSVKNGYQIALKNSWNISATPKDRSRVPDACMYVFQKILWNLPGPKSWIILIWKLLTESLPTGESFLKRGFDGPFTCLLCDSNETETPDHLFRDCSFANRIWAGSLLGIRAQSGDNLRLQCRKVFDNAESSLIGAILLYQDTLNLALSAEDRKPRSIAVQTPLEEDLTNLRNGVTIPLIQSSLSCSRSHIFVDAAWSAELAAGFGGCIMLDNDVVSEFCIKGRAENAEQAEALAIREALKWALSRNILHVNIFSDCLQVLAQVLKYSQLKYWTRNTVDDIIDLAKNFHCSSFTYVPRICNRAAHRLAKRTIKM
ncbi:uncharacterized protein LOC141649924 [Silene latifolia]|uniref:uncharacterized protein LOC141649924 n=1 Tax=Silene latifolia TaxID=37657 RepID=UPI003D76BE94